MKELNNVSVIIRSIGERTESSAFSIAAKQVGEENVRVVKNVTPFSEALRQSYLKAIAANKKWSFIMDADVLLRSNIIQYLVKVAEKSSDDVFEVNVRFFDKFFGGARFVGAKLYRTKYLEEALKYIPDAGIQNKPETHTIKQMYKKGYKKVYVNRTGGIHDFFQSYKDIYRKGFTHGVKHTIVLDKLMPAWKRLQAGDYDFQVLLYGVSQSSKLKGNLKLTPEELPEGLEEYLKEMHLKEKKNVDKLSEWRATDIDDILINVLETPEFGEVQKIIEKDMPKNSLPLKYKILNLLGKD